MYGYYIVYYVHKPRDHDSNSAIMVLSPMNLKPATNRTFPKLFMLNNMLLADKEINTF